MTRFWLLFLSLIYACGCANASKTHQEPEVARIAPSAVKRIKVAPELKKATYVVCLDPGHGGRDGGAAIKNPPLKEKTLSLEVARRTEKILKSHGFSVFMTRSQDIYLPARLRPSLANKRICDLFVSIHFNSAPCSKAGGVEIFYCNKESGRAIQSKLLGFCILNGLKVAVGSQSRGVKSANLCVIRETIMPSVLVEPAFITNPKEAKLLTTSHFLQQISKGIAKGIEDFFTKKGALSSGMKKRPRRESNARPVA